MKIGNVQKVSCFFYAKWAISPLYHVESKLFISEVIMMPAYKYPHDTALTERFVVKITVERCDKIMVAVSQIFDGVKSIALWSVRYCEKLYFKIAMHFIQWIEIME
jgi:hypothetical protein